MATAENTDVKDLCFRFKIGDFVYFDDVSRGDYVRPCKYRVIGRTFDQCPGGFQVKYHLRDYTRLNSLPTEWIHEFELKAWDPEAEKAWKFRTMEQEFVAAPTDYLVALSIALDKALTRRGEEGIPDLEELKKKAKENP